MFSGREFFLKKIYKYNIYKKSNGGRNIIFAFGDNK